MIRKQTGQAHKSVLDGLIWFVDHVINTRRQPCGLFFETGTRKPPGKVLVCAIMLMRTGSLILPVYLQKGSMSNVQPVVDANSTARSAVSAKDTYGSSCGATSMPYAMPMITCPVMLQDDMNRIADQHQKTKQATDNRR